MSTKRDIWRIKTVLYYIIEVVRLQQGFHSSFELGQVIESKRCIQTQSVGNRLAFKASVSRQLHVSFEQQKNRILYKTHHGSWSSTAGQKEQFELFQHRVKQFQLDIFDQKQSQFEFENTKHCVRIESECFEFENKRRKLQHNDRIRQYFAANIKQDQFEDFSKDVLQCRSRQHQTNRK